MSIFEIAIGEDKFFYAFVGLTVWMGVLGLVWPATILWDRLAGWRRQRRATRSLRDDF